MIEVAVYEAKTRLSELALETLFPADAATARAPRLLVGDEAGQPGDQMGNE